MHTGNTSGPIWFSVGEASGDLHGAELMKGFRTLDTSATFTGMGGPAMKAQGLDIRYSMKLISLVGITEILGGLPRILKLLGKIKRELAAVRPRAVILVDCPEFNFRIAKIAKKLGIPVYYYISPQIWAWRSGRANFLREHVRKVICILPFEKDFYKRYDMNVEYVGHPLMDVLPLEKLDQLPVQENRIGLLPGSRTKEVTTLLPVFAETAKLLKARHSDLKYVLVRAPGMDESLLRSLWPEDIPVEFVAPDTRYETFRSCKFIMAASGTVTLETALIGTPVLVAYRVSFLSMLVAKALVNVDYISLPNLILGKEIYPEHIQGNANPVTLFKTAGAWLDDPTAYETVKNELASLRTMVGDPGAPERAAGIIIRDLAELGV
ncbi:MULTISPECIES: lipid-A-disaccharide synthase [unclassified Pseudodesulfovibrio]|uniref:lipid-A-disaccharide synthase n=1 Tax=unclassified Pseudodesulfovibrio TaxID=2661612 RepID=UPI000FEB737B|nr:MULTISPECIES: lipid-A-disaccharide synthase [unclassified Pseudodesulfovibrio]MCJ2165828.1 lipid-A-disaccharide synthase [Pseudodesulfovibrio sp. S3-i]RWU02742.1 lipid-A-disaccharide synthase [Pseudodesulfovibrio sp. S3]